MSERSFLFLPVDDRGTTTGNHGPDAAILVQDGQLEGSASLGIQLLDVGLLLGQLTAERSREFHTWASIDANGGSNTGEANVLGSSGDGPLRACLELCGLIQLGSEIEVVDAGRLVLGGVQDDQGVNLEVGEVEVDVDGVEAGDEVDEDIVLGLGDVNKEGRADGVSGRELVLDLDLELECLCVDITDLDASLVGEEDVVTVAVRVDADVVLGVGGVGDEGLDEEGLEDTGDRVDLIPTEEDRRYRTYEKEMLVTDKEMGNPLTLNEIRAEREEQKNGRVRGEKKGLAQLC